MSSQQQAAPTSYNLPPGVSQAIDARDPERLEALASQYEGADPRLAESLRKTAKRLRPAPVPAPSATDVPPTPKPAMGATGLSALPPGGAVTREVDRGTVEEFNAPERTRVNPLRALEVIERNPKLVGDALGNGRAFRVL